LKPKEESTRQVYIKYPALKTPPYQN